MTIIRNERTARQVSGNSSADQLDDEEIDYRWHPTEDEFVSPLTAEQWSELLGDASFADTDAYRSVVCLRDYGGPATFQQLSIRYRGTMGRYRRWLGEAAQAAGERFGVAAPMQNQFGMDEWWPLLYRTRATGKPGAGVFEMELRDEVVEGFQLIEEQEKLAKRAENARALQRIEQIERERKEKRDRAAAEAAAKEAARRASRRPEPEDEPAFEPEADAVPAVKTDEPTMDSAGAQPPQTELQEQKSMPAREATRRPATTKKAQDTATQGSNEFPALRAFLEEMGADASEADSKELDEGSYAFDVTGAVDYALRYAERLRHVFALMQAGYAGFTAAAAARELGDESVEELQSVLNGQKIPSFAYLDKLRDRLFVNAECLEALDGRENSVPAFVSLQELLGREMEVGRLFAQDPTRIVYVVDDSNSRRTGVVFCYGPLRCALLSRRSVEGKVGRGSKKRLNAYSRMVSELDKYAKLKGIDRQSKTITEQEWDDLAAGTMWPGTIL